MSLTENPAQNNARPSRQLLPNRRESETLSFEHSGADFTMTAGRYRDGRPAKSAMKRNSRGEPSSPIGAALDRVTP